MFYKRYVRTLGRMHTVPSIWMKNTRSARFTFTKRSSMDSGFLFSSGVLAMATESLGHICTLSSILLTSPSRANQLQVGFWFWHPYQDQEEEPLLSHPSRTDPTGFTGCRSRKWAQVRGCPQLVNTSLAWVLATTPLPLWF